MATITPMQTSGYRGRLAPSPTGYLHVGHARTFWTAYQRARDAGGTLVMRMEDLDPERANPYTPKRHTKICAGWGFAGTKALTWAAHTLPTFKASE